MAKIRFFTDEQVSKAVVMGLRRRGVDVMTVPEAGTLGAPDLEQLQKAQEKGRVIVTQDDDFLRLAAAGKRHSGIVYASQEKPVGETIRGLMMIHQVMESDEMIDHVEYL